MPSGAELLYNNHSHLHIFFFHPAIPIFLSTDVPPKKAPRRTDFEDGTNIPPINVHSDKFVVHVAVIRGAAQGMGAVTAQLFAQQGAHVILLNLQEKKLQQMRQLFQL